MTEELARLFVAIGADTSEFDNKMSGIDGKISSIGSKMSRGFGAAVKSIAIGATAIAASIGGAVYKSVNSAIEFESAFAGVVKTVSATDEELATISKGIRDMAKQVPAGTTAISAVAEAAGQLGIQTENILGFTKTMIDLGEATNLTATEGASQLAQFANIVQMNQKEFDKLGSTIVALGNNTATTEADIVSMGMRIAGAGKQVGLSEHQIMSLAAGLSSVGIAADAGGTAISKVMVDMKIAAELGGESLENFAYVAGMSADEFKNAYATDAAGALNSFITGLGGLEAKGESALVVLDAMGITEVRMRDALLRASGAGELLNETLAIGEKAWNENMALTKEAESRYGTLESQMAMLKNTMNDFAITLGTSVMPAVREVVTGITGALSDGFQSSDIETIGNIVIEKITGLLKGVTGSMPEIVNTVSKALSEAINIIVTALPMMLPPLIEGAISLLKGILQSLSDNAEMIGKTISDLVVLLVEFIIDALPMIIDVGLKLIMALAKGLTESLPALIPTMVNAILEIVDMLLDNVDMLVVVAIALTMALTNGILEALPILIDKLPDIVNKIVDVLVDNLPLIINTGMQFTFALIAGILQNLPQLIVAILEIGWALIRGIGEILYNFDKAIRDKFNGIKADVNQKWGEMWQGIWDKIVSFVADIGNKFSELWSNIVTSVSTFVENMKDKFNTFISDIGTKFSEFWNNMITSVSDFVTEVKDKFIDFVKSIPTMLSNMWENIKTSIADFIIVAKEKLRALPEEIGYAIGTAAGVIATFFAELPGKVWDVLVSVYDKVMQFGIDIYTWASTEIPKFILSVVTFFAELPGKVWEKLTEAFNKIKDFGMNIYNWASTEILKFINTVVKFFAETPEKIWIELTNIYNKIKQFGTNIIDWGKVEIPKFISNVVNLFAEIPGKIGAKLIEAFNKIKDFGTNIYNWATKTLPSYIDTFMSKFEGINLRDIGKNIIEGLWKGIVGAWDSLKNAFKDFTGGIVKGFTDAFNIHSPSKLFENLIGRNIPLGIEVGLEKGKPSLMDTISGMVNTIRTTVEPDFTSIDYDMGRMVPAYETGLMRMPKMDEPNKTYIFEITTNIDGRKVAKNTVRYTDQELRALQRNRG